MAEIFHTEEKRQRLYFDRQQFRSFEDQLVAVRNAKTVYVGNLSVFTTESQIHETFSRAGAVKRVIMGLNSITKTPCGFCFVEYFKQEHAHNCLKFISGTVCDDQIIRCELDAGFVPGRQYGRGRSGGQVRDEHRVQADPLRGALIRYERDGVGGGGGRSSSSGGRTLAGGYRIVRHNNNSSSNSSGSSSSSAAPSESVGASMAEETAAPSTAASSSASDAAPVREKRKRGRDDDEDA